MNGRSALRYVRNLCCLLDQELDGARLRRAAAALAIPAAALAGGCELPGMTMEYGVPLEDDEYDCAHGQDNDWDGLVDCDDSDCRDEACLGCFDGLDNDGDGQSDCSDDSCATGEGCLNLCDDGRDNDSDGRTDCADSDCAGHSACP